MTTTLMCLVSAHRPEIILAKHCDNTRNIHSADTNELLALGRATAVMIAEYGSRSAELRLQKSE